MRLVIGDSVRLEVDGREAAMRVVSINSAGRLTLVELHEANVDKRNSNPEDGFSYAYKNAGPLQKAKTRQITISPIGELRDPGFQG